VPYVGRSFRSAAVELWTAAGVALLGAVVSLESLTHDVGWNETGPGPGYFPFRIGVLLVIAAAVRFAQSVGAPRGDAFVTQEGLRRTLSVFWPTAVLVAAMIPLGCYVPSAVYLAWMTRRHGGHGWLWSAAFGTAVMAVFFLIFELWFRVPLAKGPVEAALGLY
jgi:hypothetical protein